MEQTMPHWLTKQATLSPHRTAVETVDGRSLTFLELQQESVTFAYKLASLGVKEGKRVAILSSNSFEMIIAVHAISYLQAVAVMINTKLSKQEIRYQLDASNTMLLLQTDELQKEKELAFEPSYTFADVNNIEGTKVDIAKNIYLERPFTIMFTSGTTGKPKTVVHTYGNHWWSAIGSVLNLGLDKEDKWLLTLPIFHVGGLSILIRSVIYGMEVFLMEKYDANILYRALLDKKITIASLVTVMLKDLLDILDKETIPKSVRCILLGGGAVPEPLLKRVKEKKLPLFQSYGMTETSSQIVTLSEADSLRKIGSSGKPLFPAEIKIAAADKEGIGEIVVKGPMVIQAYEGNPEANQKSFSNGWLKTGDLGYIDEEGFLFVVERRTDLIISGGENIYPSEVENVFLELPYVQDVAVVGRSDEKWGHVPVAFIVSEDESINEIELLQYAQEKLASFKVPKTIYFLSTLPRTASNKIMRHQLAQDINKK